MPSRVQAMEVVRFCRRQRSAGNGASAVSAQPKKRLRNAVARAAGMPSRVASYGISI
jgi:hypothetical protein